MTINNKEVNYRFGMLAVEIFLQKAVDTGAATYNTFGLATILWGGIVNFYDVKELPRPVTFEEVYEYVESETLTDSDMAAIKEAVKEFEASAAMKKTKDNVDKANEELKKKLATENSDTSVDSDQANTNG